MDHFNLVKFSPQVYNVFLKVQYKIQYCVLTFYFLYIYMYMCMYIYIYISLLQLLQSCYILSTSVSAYNVCSCNGPCENIVGSGNDFGCVILVI